MAAGEPEKLESRVLLLGDSWDDSRDGIAALNQSLALEIARYPCTRIYTTILGQLTSVRSNKKQHNIEIIASAFGSYKELCHRLDSDPDSVFPNITNKISTVSFIIGHSPFSAKAAIYFRDRYYTKAKVILFYHVIPRELRSMEEEMLPYPVPTDNSLVTLAEEADLVYSVTAKCHWHFTAKFRNRAKAPIDHRRFTPVSPESIFFLERKVTPTKEPVYDRSVNILALFDGTDLSAWHGIDIAMVTINKIAEAYKLKKRKFMPSLRIANVPDDQLVKVKNEMLHNIRIQTGVKVEIVSYQTTKEMMKDLAEFDLCLILTRGDGYGCVGLAALSAGIPTLVAKDSCIASVIARLTSEPDFFTVPVTPTRESYRQDASNWRDQILVLLEDPLGAEERAAGIRIALKRDEPTKESYDDFVNFCLGGVRLQHEVKQLVMLDCKNIDKELQMVRDFNKFLTELMKQCWRLKHHPLTAEDDLFELIPGVKLPIKDLIENVTNKIEERDRRIIGVDEETGAFLVYCPTPSALTDLWADCDKINKMLDYILFRRDQPSAVLKTHGFAELKLRTIIKGPEFLTYKDDVLKNVILKGDGLDMMAS